MDEVENDEIELLKCVGSEIRYRILQILREDGKCVSEIMEILDKEQTLISHHLRSLHECGFVKRERKGRKIIYKISDPGVIDFLQQVGKLSSKFCRRAENSQSERV